MPLDNLRRSVRALIVDDSQRILLGRHALADPPGSAVWAAPGGGVKRGESNLEALRRELGEEVGLVVEEDPPLVWCQLLRGSGLSAGYDGIANDYFLVRTASFHPQAGFSVAELAAEGLEEMRWWSINDLTDYAGADLFSPRDLAGRLSALVRAGVPGEPTILTL